MIQIVACRRDARNEAGGVVLDPRRCGRPGVRPAERPQEPPPLVAALGVVALQQGERIILPQNPVEVVRAAGRSSWSTISTRMPFSRRRMAANSPTGPAPMIKTSGSVSGASPTGSRAVLGTAPICVAARSDMLGPSLVSLR
jgi:hypothetical protein